MHLNKFWVMQFETRFEKAAVTAVEVAVPFEVSCTVTVRLVWEMAQSGVHGIVCTIDGRM